MIKIIIRKFKKRKDTEIYKGDSVVINKEGFVEKANGYPLELRVLEKVK